MTSIQHFTGTTRQVSTPELKSRNVDPAEAPKAPKAAKQSTRPNIHNTNDVGTSSSQRAVADEVALGECSPFVELIQPDDPTDVIEQTVFLGGECEGDAAITVEKKRHGKFSFRIENPPDLTKETIKHCTEKCEILAQSHCPALVYLSLALMIIGVLLDRALRSNINLFNGFVAGRVKSLVGNVLCPLTKEVLDCPCLLRHLTPLERLILLGKVRIHIGVFEWVRANLRKHNISVDHNSLSYLLINSEKRTSRSERDVVFVLATMAHYLSRKEAEAIAKGGKFEVESWPRFLTTSLSHFNAVCDAYETTGPFIPIMTRPSDEIVTIVNANEKRKIEQHRGKKRGKSRKALKLTSRAVAAMKAAGRDVLWYVPNE